MRVDDHERSARFRSYHHLDRRSSIREDEGRGDGAGGQRDGSARRRVRRAAHRRRAAERQLEQSCAREQRATHHAVIPQMRVRPRVQNRDDGDAIPDDVDARLAKGRVRLRDDPVPGAIGGGPLGAQPADAARSFARLDDATRDDVSVGSLERESGHAARRVVFGARSGERGVLSRHRRRSDASRRVAERRSKHAPHVGVDRGEMRDGSDGETRQILEGLRDADDARRRLGVADARFRRLERERRRVRAPLEHRQRGSDLDGISERGSRAVHLKRRDARPVELGDAKRRANRRLLRRTVRRGERRTPTVLVHRRADDGDGGGSRLGTRRLEDQHAPRLSADVSVRGGVQGLTPSVGGEHPRGVEESRDEDAHDGADAARRGGVDVAGRDGLRRGVGGDDGGRTRGVDGEGRTAKPEHEGHAPGGDAEDVPG